MTVVSALKKNRKKLLRLPDVTGVGVGQKNGKDVIVVFVKRGGPGPVARATEKIPQTVEGYEVDIHEEIRIG
jgi:hypothetical protein